MANKGIAIIIPGADFSRSPFGKVTLTPTLDEEVAAIVSRYTTAIGSSTYTQELKTLVKSLISAGAWEGLDIYPMLGTSLETAKVNLNPTNGLLKANLLFGDNALSFTDNGVVFERIANAGANLPERTIKTINANDVGGLFFACDAVRESGITGAMRFYAQIIQILSSSSGYYMGFGPTVAPSTQNIMSSAAATSRHLWAFCIDNDPKCNIYVDGEFDKSSPAMTFSSFSLINVVGSSPSGTDAPSSWGGTGYLWVAGKIDPSKHQAVVSAIKTFMDAVKPRA